MVDALAIMATGASVGDNRIPGQAVSYWEMPATPADTCSVLMIMTGSQPKTCARADLRFRQQGWQLPVERCPTAEGVINPASTARRGRRYEEAIYAS